MELAHRLVSTRRGTLLVAMFAALIAGASIVFYLNSYRQSLQAQGALVTVLVAGDTIPKGTAGTVLATKSMYTARTMRESELLDGAISDPASLRGTVAAREILEGSQLTSADFVAAGDSLPVTLVDRERAIAVPVDTAHGMIGEIEVGNHVDIYASFNVIPLGADGRPINGGSARPMLRRIVTDAPVVAIGEEATNSSGTTNVYLELDDAKAEKVAFASDNGKVWLALRPSAGGVSSRPDLVTIETVLLGIPPIQVMQSVGGKP